MYGSSYVGATQWQAATACPPHLAAIAPRVTASNYHDGWTYQGGAFALGFNVSWTLGNLTLANFQSLAARKQIPHERRGQLVQAVDALESVFHALPLQAFPHLQDGLADYFYDWLAHPDDDAYWHHLSIEAAHSRMTVPALHIGGWYDIFMGGTLPQLSGHARAGRHTGGPAGPETAHRSLATRRLQRPWHRWGPLLRSGVRPPGYRSRRPAPALVRLLAQGH